MSDPLENLRGWTEQLATANARITALEAERQRLRQHISNTHEERAELEAERDRLRSVLGDIANPIAAMQRAAKEANAHLNGMMAVQMSSDPEYLKSLARDALKP